MTIFVCLHFQFHSSLLLSRLLEDMRPKLRIQTKMSLSYNVILSVYSSSSVVRCCTCVL